MYKSFVSIKKELLLLVNDKTGLALMFVMPLLLVLIITVIQDSAFKVVNENKISMLVVNKDEGAEGATLVELLAASGMFDLRLEEDCSFADFQESVASGKTLTGLYLREDFSSRFGEHAAGLSAMIMGEAGFSETLAVVESEAPSVYFMNDPVLQDNYVLSVVNMLNTHLNVMEVSRMLESLYAELGFEELPASVKEALGNNRIQIERVLPKNQRLIPNSTQHNVPAWTIFAMFFMVISLGSNLVLEKATGSFLRLKSMPSSFWWVMLSKQLVFMGVGILQVVFVFGVAMLLFPFLKLPPLILPNNVPGILAVVLVSVFSAVSYALMLGALSRTQEQSNGFGAISIIIFAAIGGVWVPTFVMPEYMKLLSMVSPLNWSLEAFYALFLRGGAWTELWLPLGILLVFSFICQLITFMHLHRNRLI